MSILKGVGVGLVIGGLWPFLAQVPVAGSYLIQYDMYILIGGGIALYFMGNRY